jgi:hypothetical protein
MSRAPPRTDRRGPEAGRARAITFSSQVSTSSAESATASPDRAPAAKTSPVELGRTAKSAGRAPAQPPRRRLCSTARLQPQVQSQRRSRASHGRAGETCAGATFPAAQGEPLFFRSNWNHTGWAARSPMSRFTIQGKPGINRSAGAAERSTKPAYDGRLGWPDPLSVTRGAGFRQQCWSRSAAILPLLWPTTHPADPLSPGVNRRSPHYLNAHACRTQRGYSSSQLYPRTGIARSSAQLGLIHGGWIRPRRQTSEVISSSRPADVHLLGPRLPDWKSRWSAPAGEVDQVDNLGRPGG